MEGLIDEPEVTTIGATDNHSQESAGCTLCRERIAEAVSVGNAKNLLGRSITHDQLSHISVDEINTLYAEHTLRMERSMGEGISHLATKTYTGLVKKVFSVGDHYALQDELNNNPVLQLVLSVIAGEAYHKFGLGLAPLSVMISTIQQVDVTQFGFKKSQI